MSRRNPTIKERIAIVETKIDNITRQVSNHLRHHFTINLVLLTALLGLIGIILKLIFGK